MKRALIENVIDYINQKFRKPWLFEPALYLNQGESYNIEKYRISGVLNEPVKIHQVDVNGKIEEFYIIDKDHIYNENKYVGSDNNESRWGFGRTAIPYYVNLPYLEKFGQPDPKEERGDWAFECRRSARKIYEKFGDHLFLGLSGGIDSELMAISFLEEKIPFIAYIMMYVDLDGSVLNSYDISNAIKLCEENNIKHIVKTIPIIKWYLDKKYLEYSNEVDFLIPGLMTHMFLVDDIHKNYGGVPVMGSDQTELRFNSLGDLTVGFNSLDVGLTTPIYAQKKNIPNVYCFFNYSPNQIASYLDITEVHTTKTLTYNDFKYPISKKYGSSHLSDRTVKYSGFEGTRKAYEKYGRTHHHIMIELADKIDWDRKPVAHYAYPVKDYLQTGKFEKLCLMKMTPMDYLVCGFKENDVRYKFDDPNLTNLFDIVPTPNKTS